MPFNYGQPIDTQAVPPPEDVTAAAMEAFDRARATFAQGEYQQALVLTNQALRDLPNDTSIHEFRALVLFALQQYDEASQVLYAVLSVSPGWDWTTMISLYPDADVYTTQLRQLEQYVRSHPDSASSRFLLAYHYLTMGSVDEAAALLRKVVELKPTDQLSRGMLKLIEQPADAEAPQQPEQLPTPAEAVRTPAEEARESVAPPAPVDPTASQQMLEQIQGSWQAQPDDSTTIALTLREDSTFEWQVQQQEEPRTLKGQFTFGGNLLTLAADDGSAMVGNVVDASPDSFQFRLVGTPASEPGLTFTRSQ